MTYKKAGSETVELLRLMIGEKLDLEATDSLKDDTLAGARVSMKFFGESMATGVFITAEREFHFNLTDVSTLITSEYGDAESRTEHSIAERRLIELYSDRKDPYIIDFKTTNGVVSKIGMKRNISENSKEYSKVTVTVNRPTSASWD